MNVLDVTGHVVLTLSVAGAKRARADRQRPDRPRALRRRHAARQRLPHQRRGAGRAGRSARRRQRLRRSVGLGFSVSAPLALNTTGRRRPSGRHRSHPASCCAWTARSTSSASPRGAGFAEIRIAAGAFEMPFGVSSTSAGLTFRASGVAGRLRRQRRLRHVGVGQRVGRRVRLQPRARAAPCSSTPRGDALGRSRRFKLQLTGSVTLLKVFSFDAGIHVEVGKTRRPTRSTRATGTSTPTRASTSSASTLSGSIFLNSDGNFNLVCPAACSSAAASASAAASRSGSRRSTRRPGSSATLPPQRGRRACEVRAFGDHPGRPGHRLRVRVRHPQRGMDGDVPIELSVTCGSRSSAVW